MKWEGRSVDSLAATVVPVQSSNPASPECAAECYLGGGVSCWGARGEGRLPLTDEIELGEPVKIAESGGYEGESVGLEVDLGQIRAVGNLRGQIGHTARAVNRTEKRKQVPVARGG